MHILTKHFDFDWEFLVDLDVNGFCFDDALFLFDVPDVEG